MEWPTPESSSAVAPVSGSLGRLREISRRGGKRYPQVDFAGIEWTLLEKEAGYLLARRSCADVVEGFLAEGGVYREAMASLGTIAGGRLGGVALSDGTRLRPDAYVFACGPWLPKLFPGVVGSRIEPTRQEVFYFGTPGGDVRFSERNMPVWVETPRFFYGIPGNERRGFKIADDERGEAFDPTSGDRTASAEALRTAREYLARRFPELASAPLSSRESVSKELARHHSSSRHPEAGNVRVWGGSATASTRPAWDSSSRATCREKPPSPFSLSRFQTKS